MSTYVRAFPSSMLDPAVPNPPVVLCQMLTSSRSSLVDLCSLPDSLHKAGARSSKERVPRPNSGPSGGHLLLLAAQSGTADFRDEFIILRLH